MPTRKPVSKLGKESVPQHPALLIVNASWRLNTNDKALCPTWLPGVHLAKVFGICEKQTGIEPYHRLVDLVMQQKPYRTAKRVFWVTDIGSSYRGVTSCIRLSKWYPNAIQVHTPIHASRLNQVEIYFSVIQQKLLTPNDFPDLATLKARILNFQKHYKKSQNLSNGNSQKKI